jgi:hypothetical protein
MSLLVGFVAIVAGATALATLLRLPSVVSFLLAAYVIAWTEVVVTVFALSAVHRVERWTLLATLVGVAASALLAWWLRGRPRPPPVSNPIRVGIDALRDPLVALPASVSAVALLYTLVVTLTTAQNDGDPLAYELSRAAFWRQEHAIVDVGAPDARLDFWPPVAETTALVVMTLSRSDQFTGIAQWLAVLVLVLATYGVGRRIGLDRPAALWAAAVVPAFPVVITQSWSAFTDVVFASFAVVAVYFGIGSRRAELVPLAIAAGLAMGTKFVGPILAPLFLAILVLAQPARRWLPILAAALAGAVVASLWYLRTHVETGDPIGTDLAGLQSRELAPVVTTFSLLASETFDLSGAVGRDEWLYAIAALCLGVAAVASRRLELRVGQLVVAMALIAATPLLVAGLGTLVARSGVALGEALGRPDLVDQLRDWSASEVSDGAYSWFGPVGAALVIGAIVIAVDEFRHGRVSRPAIALAAAPLVAIALVSVTISYQNHQGRYLIAPFALCIATCGGFALRHRWLGATVGCVVAATVVLVLVNSLGKPTGISVLRGDQGRSVWSLPRWEQQGILRPTPAERDEVMTIRFVEENVPEEASVGVALTGNSFIFPYFGDELARRLTVLDPGEPVPADVDWIVASPEQPLLACAEAWSRERLGSFGWSVWRRVAPDSCSRPQPFTT